MPSHRERRILLVEDSDSQAETLSRRFREAGYEDTRAETFEEARQYLRSEYFHLAVIDVCLDSSQGESQQGLGLLQEMKQMRLCELLPVIIITAYGSYELLKRLLEGVAVDGYVEKEPGYIAGLLAKIHQVFADKIPINFELEFLADSEQQLERCVEYIHQADNETRIRHDVLVPQAFDLIRKMFRSAKSVMLDPLAEGLSGAAILRAHPTYSQGLTRPIVAKIGRRAKVEKEQQHYQDNVRLFLTGNCTTQLETFYTRDMGGLLYTLNLTGVYKDLKEFFEFESAATIVGALENLFRKTCAPWYGNRKAARYANLRDLYLEAFELTDKPQRIPHEIKELHPEIDWTAKRIALAPLNGDYPNPLLWLANERVAWMPVCTCVTHGDLHANNILINANGECWLIDFYRTYPSHILRDFVILETDLKYRVMGDVTPSDFVTFERALLDWQPPHAFHAALTLPPRIRKASEVIVGLRTQAWSLLDWQVSGKSADAQREYLASLLMATLNVLRLRHMKSPALAPRRELALVSALLICERLEQLGLA